MNLQEAVKKSKSEQYAFPDIIDSKDGLYSVPELNTIGISSWDRLQKGKKRKITLQIRTFKGISSNAIHYYGKLIVDGVYTASLDNVEHCVSLSSENGKKHPLLSYNYEFELKRAITASEIITDKDRWYAYSEGDLTAGYETIEELIQDATAIVKLRFTGEWEFIVISPRGEKTIVKI